MMQVLFDEDNSPLSAEERAAMIEDAQESLRGWKKRALYSTAAFLLSCASVVPFLYGYPYHAYWDSLGKCLLLLSMALLAPFLLCLAMAAQVWIDLRNLRKTET